MDAPMDAPPQATVPSTKTSQVRQHIAPPATRCLSRRTGLERWTVLGNLSCPQHQNVAQHITKTVYRGQAPSSLLSETAPILLQGPPPLDTLPRCSALSWGWWWGSSVRAHRSWQRTSFSASNCRL